MNLKSLDLDTFMNIIVKVNKLLSNEITCNELLDAAKKDTPIIDQLMAEINKLYDCESSPQKKKGLVIAQRDLTVLLALREIEKQTI